MSTIDALFPKKESFAIARKGLMLHEKSRHFRRLDSTRSSRGVGIDVEA